MNLSPHFTLAELCATTRQDGADIDGDGIRNEPLPNAPDAMALANLRALCANVLEPVRALLGVPLRVNSGYRSKAVNAAVHGAATSQHLLGLAADVVPIGMSAEGAMERIAAAVKGRRLSVGQAIVYASGFLHLSWDSTRAPRNEILRSLADRGSGGPYRPWAPRSSARVA